MQQKLGLSNVTFFEADLDTCDLQTLGQFDAVYNVGLLYHVADQDRRAEGVGDKVRLAAARIYNRLAREATGEFV